jgi:vanillate O-demethylase monooxygenase subunit
MNAAADRQIEGFLDVSHFAFVHEETFGEVENPEVPDYPVTNTALGFVADYISTVSNYSKDFKHLNPPGFLWRRRFETFLPWSAKLTVFFPNGSSIFLTQHHPCRPARQATLDFNHQVFAEDQAIVEQQYPEDLPLDLHAEAHFPADRSLIPYRRGLAAMGLGRALPRKKH